MEGPQEDLNKSLEKGSCKFPSVHVRVTLLPPLQRQPADFPPRVMDPSPGQAVKNVSVHNSVQKRWLQTGLERSSRQRNQNINPFLFLFLVESTYVNQWTWKNCFFKMRGSCWTREIFRETGAVAANPVALIKCNET